MGLKNFPIAHSFALRQKRTVSLCFALVRFGRMVRRRSKAVGYVNFWFWFCSLSLLVHKNAKRAELALKSNVHLKFIAILGEGEFGRPINAAFEAKLEEGRGN